MQVLKFLRWLFNVSQWDNFTKRISVYMIIGIGGLFFMENSVPVSYTHLTLPTICSV